MKIPTLTKLTETDYYTTWKAVFPPDTLPAQQGAIYRVTTYPGTEQIVVTSWVRNRRVVNARRIEQILAGLKHAA